MALKKIEIKILIPYQLALLTSILGIDMQTYISIKNKAHKTGWAIIIKFTRYNIRKKVFINKRKFKGTNISVTESLTSWQMAKLKYAGDEYGFNKVWTPYGRIMVIEEGSAKVSYG